MDSEQISEAKLPSAEALEAQRVESENWASVQSAEGLVLFRLGSVLLAVPAARVEQIARGGVVTALPRSPRHILGVTNLQRYPLPLLDVGRFLGISPGFSVDHARALDEDLRTLVISVGEMRVGLVCHQVLGIVQAEQAQLREPVIPRSERFEGFVKAELEETQGVVAVLDLDHLLKEIQC